ncbi:4-hydroxymandelate oxidase [Allocatelliglobosispora scoriae]|uniref:4-hydroxymandelate oxidase n=1 Tax=Allocatelliglobosispora scoriae TaxID=643052 RepID=A0A841C0M2_9ACTN|nr:alpha-hydroxy acid oxidase [Allocatelliglobosispora scoriae]MBB5872602.1 4-hydroxymandelate oxidase [Allocatelliglobosispora scoriae]
MSIVCADDYRSRARGLLPAPLWDFIEGGSGDELTVDANRLAFDRISLRPRVLVDVSERSTATSVFGAALASPIGIAPTAYQRMLHPEGEVATARGAGQAGGLFVVSIFASRTLEEIAAAATGPLWLQLYWLRQRSALSRLVARAETAGYQALVLTVDAPVIGKRLRDLRNGFAIDAGVRAVNLDDALTEGKHISTPGTSAIATHAAATFDTSITWADLSWLRSTTALPLVLKGILTAEDAELAVAHGVDGIIVSNHGGRQLDGAIPAMRALPEVVAAVAGRVPVLLDGGVRRGRDILIALASGADAVLIGRPALWALTVDGSDGVAHLLSMLTEELSHTMALTGRPKLADLDPTVLA